MSAAPTRPSRHSLRLLLVAVAVLWVGFILRANQLDAKDLWVDEAHPWHFATLPLLESISLGFSGGPINSGADPLFNILLHFWIKVVGDSVYALRYLSVITNLLSVALLGRVARRVFSWPVGMAALTIGSVAPLWVFYSQEVRPYAFTPALMLAMVDAVIRLDRGDPRSTSRWGYLTGSEVLALYTHGFMLVGIVAINGWLAVLTLRRWRQPQWGVWIRGWLFSQVAAGVLLIPTISLNLARAGGIQNPFATPRTAPQFANELWSYLMGIPWEQVFEPIPLRVVVALVILGVAVGLIVALRRNHARTLADLLCLTLGIGVMALLYMWRDPSFHPRYVVFMSGPLFVIIAAVTVRLWEAGRGWRVAGVTTAVLLVISSASGLDNLYTGRYSGDRHPSTQVVAETIRKDFDPQDAVVVVAPHDFTLNYYGTGSVPILWSRFDEGIDQPGDLLAALKGKQKIGVLRNTNERSDSRRILPFYLERYGKLVSHQLFEGYDLSIYQPDANTVPHLAIFYPADFNWGVLSIDSVSIESDWSDARTIAVHWVAGPSFVAGTRYAASIRLVDNLSGWQISGADSLLLADNGDPTERWQPGQIATQYFVLPLQPGTPMIMADLQLTLYEVASGRALDLRDQMGNLAGQQAKLGSVGLPPPPIRWVYDDSLRLWQLQPVVSSIVSGYVADRTTISPRSNLGVTLAWLITRLEVDNVAPTIQIVQGTTVIAQQRWPVLQGRPSADVPPGSVWLDRRVLPVTTAAQPGKAALQVVMPDHIIPLGELDVVGFDWITQRPAIENPLEAVFGKNIKLLGYKLYSFPNMNSTLPVYLTLYWQALADGSPEANYKVTAQMLSADGHLVGQHDGDPVGDTRPFSGWVSGEYLIDEHKMTFNQPYSGPITIQVALYDPVTFERILTDTGANAVVLPIHVQVESIP